MMYLPMSGVRHRLLYTIRKVIREAPERIVKLNLHLGSIIDSASPILGITLGRTQLFALSPKKTVEGFVGALFSTLIFGFLVRTRFTFYRS